MSRAQLTSTVEQNTGGAVSPYVAGKNILINGGMDIWQRGTSSTGIGTAKTFLADRWYANSANAATTFGYTQSSSVTTGFQYAAKIQRTASNTGTNAIYFQQDIETSNSIPFAGQTVTISLYAKAGANFSSASNALSVNLVSGTGTDQSQYFAFLTGQATVASGTATLTTSYQRFAFTGTVSSSATQLGISINYTPVGTAGADDSFFVTGVQVERGSVATPFSRAGGTLSGELEACQRYYWRVSGATNPYVGLATCVFNGGTTPSVRRAQVPLPTSMRTSPSVAVSGTTQLYTAGLTNLGSPSIQANYPAAHFLSIDLISTSAGTLGQSGWWIIDSSSGANYLEASAEL